MANVFIRVHDEDDITDILNSTSVAMIVEINDALARLVAKECMDRIVDGATGSVDLIDGNLLVGANFPTQCTDVQVNLEEVIQEQFVDSDALPDLITALERILNTAKRMLADQVETS